MSKDNLYMKMNAGGKIWGALLAVHLVTFDMLLYISD